MSERGTFGAFLRECRAPLGAAFLKLLIRLPLALLLAFVLFLLLNELSTEAGDQRFYRLSDFLRAEAWADLNTRLWTGLLVAYLVVLPIWVAQVLYLEWDKYKKDKPSGFIYGGWLNPNRPWVLSNLERLAANTPWQGVAGVHIQQLGPDHSRATAEWREAQVLALVQGVVRRLTSLLRKPVEQREGLVRWHILANSGDELHITLKRQPTGHGDWVLSVDYHEWVGRTTPVRLMRSVVTEFVCGAVAAPVVADVDGR